MDLHEPAVVRTLDGQAARCVRADGAPFALAACLLPALLCVTVIASAQDVAGLSLRWDAPADCPSRQNVLAGVQSTLGSTTQRGAELSVQAKVAQRSAGYEATLEFTGGSVGRAERTLQADSCQSLADASALVIALTIDPGVIERVRAQPKPAPAPPVAPSPVPAPGPPAPPALREPAVQSKPSRPIKLGFEAGAGFVLSSGVLPFVAPGTQGTVALQIGRLRIAAQGLWLPPQLTPSAQDPRVGSELGLVSGALLAGYEWRFSSLALGPYVGASLASVFGEARGPGAVPRHSSVAVGALEAGAAAAWYLVPWLGLRLEGGLIRPSSRPRFVVQGLGFVHQASAIAGQISLGFFLHID